ncbi:helix-turn-helix domain-containing protein [Candidatus Gottesmanbacteria bacterium]|nr:helix-turn-helix domain-containing protein [Candidatus Gottesmanbacteria bacterium]
MQDIVTVDEAATFLHKHPDTIRRWIETKKLKARRLSAGGHGIYAILRNDLLELIVSGSLEAKEKPVVHPKVPDNQRTLPL